MEEIIINEENFNQYFRDVRISRPERGDIMAKWMGRAEFVHGDMKKNIIDLLYNKEKALAATQVMMKLGHATQKDAVKVCKEICQDLDSGMSFEEVENKSYAYDIEMFFYTKKEYVPKDDPHWCVIGIENLDEFLQKDDKKVRVKSKIVMDKKDD